MYGDKFRAGYELSDYGKLLFEYDDTRGQLEMSDQKRKAMLKNPGFYYIIAIIAVLGAWFIASLISNAKKHGFAVSLGMHASGFFVLFVMSLLLILSVGGFWGKFIRWNASKTANIKSFNTKEKDVRDMVDSVRNALQIYEDWIVITNTGVTNVYNIHMVDKVKMNYVNAKRKSGYYAAFLATSGEIEFARVVIPNEKTLLFQLKKIFGDNIEIERPVKKAVVDTNKRLGQIVGPLVFVSIAILAGVGVIIMHFYVAKSIPVFLGAFFIIGGMLGICGTLDFIPILKDVVVPLLFGAVFLFFPYMLMDLVYKSNNKVLTVRSFFELFNPFGAAVIFFGGLGLLCVIGAIKTVMDYIRYREKKD